MLHENTYTAPTGGQRLSIPAEYLRDAIRDAEKVGQPDDHDPALVAATPGAAELLAEVERLKAEGLEASRAVARHGAEHKTEWQNPHTPAGRIDTLNAEKAALQAEAARIGAEAARTRRALWEALYVVDDETRDKRRTAAAAEADAQHARAVQALADLHDAIERRERAYVTVGHPGDRDHWSFRRPAALGSIQPPQVFTQGFRLLDAFVPVFPADVAGLYAEAQRAEKEATR